MNMNVLQDMILPTIIVGMLMTTILGVQMMMVESSVDNRVTQNLQGFADIAVQVIQEDVRHLQQIVDLTDSTLVFRNTNNEVVSMNQNGRDLRVLKTSVATSDTISFNDHAVRLSALSFESVTMHGVDDIILRVRVQTESTPDEEVGNRTHRHSAFAHKDIYLRNLHLN